MRAELSDRSSSPLAVALDAPVLEARSLSAGYSGRPVVRDLDITLARGEISAILGPNGAGKTTALLTLAGALPPMGGDVLWHGRPTTKPLHQRVREGMGFVPEERSVVSGLSTLDNLRLGLGSVDDALGFFPQLEPLLSRPAGLLSGGEQQMVTLGRALASRPAALLVDELSLGLAPLVIDHLLTTLRDAADRLGMAVLLVEQQARRALHVADTWHLLRHGRVVASGDRSSRMESLEAIYLASALEP